MNNHSIDVLENSSITNGIQYPNAKAMNNHHPIQKT
jgi:hypothetical protein